MSDISSARENKPQSEIHIEQWTVFPAHEWLAMNWAVVPTTVQWVCFRILWSMGTLVRIRVTQGRRKSLCDGSATSSRPPSSKSRVTLIRFIGVFCTHTDTSDVTLARFVPVSWKPGNFMLEVQGALNPSFLRKPSSRRFAYSSGVGKLQGKSF